MPPRKKIKTQNSNSTSSRWNNGDFELVSSDGTSFRVPTYQLQAASTVFRDMVETCSGEKRVELDEKDSTVDWFLRLSTGNVSFLESLCMKPNWPGTLELLHFVKKYDCAMATNQLKIYLRLQSTSPWNPHLRVLIAMHLNLTHEIANMIENEPDVFRWLRPSAFSSYETDLSPYDLFCMIPHRYLWALSSPDVLPRTRSSHYIRGSDHDALARRESFLCLLAQTENAK